MSFNIFLVAMIAGGWAGGRLLAYFRLPSVLGMIFWGILFSFLFREQFPDYIWELSPSLISVALITILLRAGLGIRKDVLQKVGMVSIRMALIPCLFEGVAVTFISHYFLAFSWTQAGMMGFILAAVSPAVVVPSMLMLKTQGYGKKNEVPTVLLAGASLDNVVAITMFAFFLNISLEERFNYLQFVMSVPYAMIIGIAIGLLSGAFFAWFFKKHSESIRATEKVILILIFSIFLVQVGIWLHIASLLAIIMMGFVLLENAETVAHELASKLGKVWVLAEIFLFVLIGMAVDIPTALQAGASGLAIIACGLGVRSVGVMLALAGTSFNFKERLFCVIGYIPKATVQAALGAIPLLSGIENGGIILSIAVLSICVTTPVGLFGIRYFAPRLLHMDLSTESTGVV